MNFLRRFRPAAVAAASAGLLVLAACGGGGGSTAASGGNSTLKVSFFPDNPTFSCIDPFQVYWIEGRSIIRNFADSLTDQDPQTGKIVPWLAKSWDVSADGKTYTFHLRDGVTFSNGKKVDAQAVADDATGWIATVKATNAAAVFVPFKPFDERVKNGQSADSIIRDIFGRMQAIEEAFIIAIARSLMWRDIRKLSRSCGGVIRTLAQAVRAAEDGA